MRAGPCVSRLMLIQKASDSINPPLRPSIRTRISHQRFDVPEHQRRSRSISGYSIGRIRSTIVRRTIHSGCVSSWPISRSWSWPTSWMCLHAASRRSRAARSISPTRSGHSRSNTSGCGSGTGINTFANPVLVVLLVMWCVVLSDPVPARSCQRASSMPTGLRCQRCEAAFAHVSRLSAWPRRSSAPGYDSCAANVDSARRRWPRCWRFRRATSTRSSTMCGR